MGIVKFLLVLCCITVATATFSGFKWRGLGDSLYKRAQHHRNARQVSQKCLDALGALNQEPLKHCVQLFQYFDGQFGVPSEKNVTDFCSPNNCGDAVLKAFRDISTYCGTPGQSHINPKQEMFLHDSCIIDPAKNTCILEVFHLLYKPPSTAQSCYQAFQRQQVCNSDCEQLLNWLKGHLGCCEELSSYILTDEYYNLLQDMWTACKIQEPAGCGKGTRT